jgi:hypothetical protein
MFFILLISIILGTFLGLMHSFVFRLQLKNLQIRITNQTVPTSEKEIKRQKIKNILSFTSFYLLSHLLLISLLAFFIIKLDLNISVVIIFLIVSFWIHTLKSIN